MKNVKVKLIVTGLIGVAMLAACSKGSVNGNVGGADSKAGGDQNKMSYKDKFLVAASQDQNEIQWNTKDNVSHKRQVEVGEHPNIVMEAFKIGQRDQQVRFFVADEKKASELFVNSPQDNLMKKDIANSKTQNSKWSLYGMIIDAPSNLGMQKFSQGSLFNGMAVNPGLIMCASDGLKVLKQAGDKLSKVFQNWQINTVNVYVKAVQQAADAESKISVDGNTGSINFQLSLWTRSGDCFVPSQEEIEEALNIANLRRND